MAEGREGEKLEGERDVNLEKICIREDKEQRDK